MQKVRVYQLAKELNVHSALILELLDRMGQEVRSDLSMLDVNTADLVRERVTVAIEAEKRRILEQRELIPHAEGAEEPPALAASPAVSEPEAPVAAETADSEGAAPEAPVPKPLEPLARRIEPPTAPPAPRAGLTKPRVFPARRIPTASNLAKTARAGLPTPARVGTIPAVPPGRPGPLPARPGAVPVRPGPPPGRRRRRKDKSVEVVAPPSARPRPDLPPVPAEITLSEGVTVKELAEKLNRKSKDVIAKLLARGVLATINQPLEPQTAIDVAKEFGSVARVISFEEEAQLAPQTAPPDGAPVVEIDGSKAAARPPVVTVMGHVDHGKTSLLDAIRAANVVDQEAGGITQHIGAYQVEERGRKITFLDTPGHEAFTLMRARGAKATDIVVLVVAADDGVKPQTVEAIDHARAAEVPLLVAINKIDKPGANPDRVKQQLADHGLLVESWGGETVSCEVSAKKRVGLDELLEMILIVADLEELRAEIERPATGVVLEARLDRARGIVATVLVQNGTLSVGDSFIAGTAYGKVRAMSDELGRKVDSAGPSTPVEVMGFAGEPAAGDSFQAVTDEAKARQIAGFRQDKLRSERQRVSARRSLEALSKEIAAGGRKELHVLLKCDVHGSVEALQSALADLPSDKIRVNVLRASIGAISQADVLLASASDALIIGFNVRPDRTSSELAKREEVEIRLYTVIYDLLDDIKKAMLGLLEPTIRESVLGQAEVRNTFKISRIGTIAGCYVTDGRVTRNSEVRLLRDSVVVFTGKVGSLRRFKEDVSEVKQGFECGIDIANYNDIKVGDVIEFFVREEIAAESL
jgi:translation initiation factor IF-2